jgi:hypothetical protein
MASIAAALTACAHQASEVKPVAESACLRTPEELNSVVQREQSRMQICAELRHAEGEVWAEADVLFLTFVVGADGHASDIAVSGPDSVRAVGRVADCFAGVVKSVALGNARGGPCPVAVPLRLKPRAP